MPLKRSYKSIVFAAFFMLLSACADEGSADGKFVISGTVTGLDNTAISLVEYTGNGDEVVIDATTMKEGTYVLKGSTLEPKPAYILFDDRYEASIFLEEGKLTVSSVITGSKNDFELELEEIRTEIKGSKLNELFTRYNRKMDSVEQLPDSKKLKEIVTEYAQALSVGDTLMLAGLEDSMYALTARKDVVQDALRKDFALAHSSSVLAPYIMLYEGNGFDDFSYSLAEMQAVFDGFSPELKQNRYYQECFEEIEKIKRLNVGRPAPEFELPTPEGTKIALSDFKGDFVLLDFWAHWCAPCTQSFPEMKRLHEKYAAKGFEILSISDDPDEELWKKAIAEHHLTWPQVIVDDTPDDAGMLVSNIYNVDHLPTSYLLDAEGKILGKNLSINAMDALLAQKLTE